MSVDNRTGKSTLRSQAAELLVHYLKIAGDNGQWQGDNTVEVHEIVDLIVDAAVEETVRRLQH